MIHPPLPDSVTVLPGTDVEGEWGRFAPFEAMHHLHEICNPMDPVSLEEILDRLAPADGERMIDVACGHGEFLLRAAERSAIEGVGLDLSPWVLARASGRARDRTLRGTVDWWLGDGNALDLEQQWDVVTCLGASWIWHGFSGTLRALAGRTHPGGRIAIGDLRTKTGLATEAVEAVIGAGTKMTTEADQIGAIRQAGLHPIHCYVSPEEAWAGYHRLVIESADTYQGPDPAVNARAMARAWQEEFERDRRILEWTVWIAKNPGHPASP
jgi:SAM-dependent methyltransferase